MQFAMPAALDLLRSLRPSPDAPCAVVLAAVDPANPYGALVRWPPTGDDGAGRGPTRSAGTYVVLVDGHLAGWLGRGGQALRTWLPEHEPDRSRHSRALAQALAESPLLRARHGGLLIAEIDGTPATDHPFAPSLAAAGFTPGARGYARVAPHA